MADKIGSLVVEIKATVDQFNANMKAAQKEIAAFQKAYAPTIDLLKTGIATAAAAGAAVVTALAAAVKISADYGDAMRDASIRTGLVTETLAGLRYQAEQTGTSFGEVSTGLRFLARNMAEAIDGSREQQEAFADLGISVNDLKAANGQLEPVLRMVMDRFARMPDGAEKSAAAMALFGRSGVQLTEFLNQSAAGLDRNIALATLFGLNVGKDATDAADAFNDALNQLKQASLGLTLSVGNQLIPALTEGVQLLTASVVVGRQWGATLANLVSAAAKLSVTVDSGVKAMGAFIGRFVTADPVFVAFLADVFKTSEQIKELSGNVEPLGDDMVAMWEKAKAAAERHNELVAKGVEILRKIREQSLKDELAAYQQKLKDEETAGEYGMKASIERYQQEREARLRELEVIDAALKEQKERAKEYEEEITENLDRNLDYRSDQMLKANKERIDDINDTLDEIKKAEKEAAEAMEEAVRDMRDAAGEIFDDMFLKGQSVFESLGNALKGGALSLGRAIFQDIVGHLLGPVKKAFDDFLGGLLGGISQKLGSIVAGVLGVGGGAAGGILTAGGGAAGGAAAGAGAGGGIGLGAFLGTTAGTALLGGGVGAGMFALAGFLGGRGVNKILGEGPAGDFRGDLDYLAAAIAQIQEAKGVSVEEARAVIKPLDWQQLVQYVAGLQQPGPTVNIYEQPGTDTSQLVNEIIRFLQSNPTAAMQTREALGFI